MPSDSSRGETLYRVVGRTGERVSAVGLGEWHLGLSHVDEALSVRVVREAIDRGINFLDNSSDYNDGASEIRMGRALKNGYRQKASVMMKIDGRSKAEATRQLNESLRRLGTDCIDLVQHHEVNRFEDPHRIFDEEGANAALIEAGEATAGASRAREAEHRCAGDEKSGKRCGLEGRRRDGHRVSSVRPQPSHISGDHRHR
jgi:aryl-alcohol dehydrogenase-like predicted oxidoreductase